MFCTKCGQKNDDSAKFCNHCGSPMSADDAGKSDKLTEYRIVAKARSGAIMSLIGALFGVVISILLYVDNNAGGRFVLCLMYISMAAINISIICNVPVFFRKLGSILNVIFSLCTTFLVAIIALGGVIQLFSMDIAITFFYVPILVVAEIILVIGSIKTATSIFSNKRR